MLLSNKHCREETLYTARERERERERERDTGSTSCLSLFGGRTIGANCGSKVGFNFSLRAMIYIYIII